MQQGCIFLKFPDDHAKLMVEDTTLLHKHSYVHANFMQIQRYYLVAFWSYDLVALMQRFRNSQETVFKFASFRDVLEQMFAFTGSRKLLSWAKKTCFRFHYCWSTVVGQNSFIGYHIKFAMNDWSGYNVAEKMH